jgi:hypothetical protein
VNGSSINVKGNAIMKLRFRLLAAAVLLLFLPAQFSLASYVAPPYEVTKGGTGDTSFTSNLPLIGNGSSALSQGTVSGNTTDFATVSGSLTSGDCLKADANGNIVTTGSACSTSSGTVTSVAFADGSTTPIYTISGSPVTTSGTLTETLATQTANTVFAGPSSGSAAQPTFRVLVQSDIPLETVTNGGNTAYTILATDENVRTGTALTTGRTYTLPACVSGNIGKIYKVKNTPSQTFNITVAANGSDTVDGAATYVLAPGDSVTVICAVAAAWDVE